MDDALLKAVREEWERTGSGAWRIKRILDAKGISAARMTITRALERLRASGAIPHRGPGDNRSREETENAPVPQFLPSRIDPSQVGYPAGQGIDLSRENAQLRAELSALQGQIEWLTHAEAEAGWQGGTVTINLSDLHYHDATHLLTALRSCEDKTLTVLRRFRPRRILGLINGDAIPGRGIYKEQAMDAVLPRTDQQVSAGAYRFWEFDCRIREATGMSPRWTATFGNHDFSMGELTMDRFVYVLRLLGVSARYVGQYWVENIADKGRYNLLGFHGYGHSQTSPSSPALLTDTYKLLLRLANEGYAGDRRIRRVTHAHTHWLSEGLERAADLPFDVTGGFQRFERVNRGWNERPCGWILYLSPPGSEDVTPMRITPERHAINQDLTDPMLRAANMAEAARCLQGFLLEAKNRGLVSHLWTESEA